MIGKLRGIIDEIADTHIILDVQGAGYRIFISDKTLQALPSRGQASTLWIETYIREDSFKLFGFINRAEQQWFRLLQNVQGVGAKSALAILGTLSPEDLAHAIALRDAAALCRAPGIGKKVAERLITELKNKAPAILSFDTASARQQEGSAVSAAHNAVSDAISALSNLGYSREQAANAVSAAAKQTDNAGAAELIRLGLQFLAKK